MLTFAALQKADLNMGEVEQVSELLDQTISVVVEQDKGSMSRLEEQWIQPKATPSRTQVR